MTKYEVKIYNSESVATSAPFQQMITVYSTTISKSNNAEWTNIYFTSAEGTTLYSWLESRSTSSAIFWVKLNSSIPANSTTIIYLYSSTSSVVNGTTVGIAPQLSTTYGQYDNGANVFTYYTRFGGNSLPSGWAGFGSSYSLSYSTTHLTIETTDSGSIYGGIYTTSQVPSIPSIYEFYGNIYTSDAYNYAGVLDTSSPSSAPYHSSAYVIQVGSRPDWDIVGSDNGYYYDTGYANQNITQVYSLAISTSTTAQFFYNYNPTPPASGLLSEAPLSFVFTGSGGSPLYLYWYRVRAYVSSMPSVSITSASGTLYVAAKLSFVSTTQSSFVWTSVVDMLGQVLRGLGFPVTYFGQVKTIQVDTQYLMGAYVLESAQPTLYWHNWANMYTFKLRLYERGYPSSYKKYDDAIKKAVMYRVIGTKLDDGGTVVGYNATADYRAMVRERGISLIDYTIKILVVY